MVAMNLPTNLRTTQMFKNRTYNLLSALLLFIVGIAGAASCGESADMSTRTQCDLAPQRNEQRLSGKKREDYYPKVFSRDFSRDYGVDISPSEKDYDTVRKVSRSVFEIEFQVGDGAISVSTGFLIAPRYVVTAAHSIGDNPQVTIRVHTFDGDTIEAERVYADPEKEDGTDLALLRLKEEIDAVPMKIAKEHPERNELLMAIGGGQIFNGLGGWGVSAGPALELGSGHLPPLNRRPGRVYHAVVITPGMSGGPIFNDRGEVVSIVSLITHGLEIEGILRDSFGVTPFQVPNSPPENLWLYAFDQPDPKSLSSGPNPEELKEVFDKIPDEEKPDNAGDYRSDNKWEKAGDEFGNEYSPFPLDQFDHMQDVYRRARESTVEIRVDSGGYGSGFIYDANTVITAGHVVPLKGEKVRITAFSGGSRAVYRGTVLKTQYQDKFGGCDIAVIRTDGSLGEHQTLEIADSSSSLQCGDPLVAIGSAAAYNSVGLLQGVGAVHMRAKPHVLRFFSRSLAGGMSGGPLVDKNGRVVSLNSTIYGLVEEVWNDPGPLLIRTRLPFYPKQDFSEGPSAEIIKRFADENEFFCPE